MSPTRMTRLALGAGLVATPARLLALVGAPDAGDGAVQVVARILGGRYLLQGIVGRPTGRVAAVVELTHAASMVPIAVRSRRHGRAALTSAGAAVAIAGLDLI